MTNYDVLKTLIGEIDPIGNTEIDETRFENLYEMIDVVNGLIEDIAKVANRRSRLECSLKKAGEKAYNFLKDLQKQLSEI